MKRIAFVFCLLLVLSTAYAVWMDSVPDSGHIGVGADERGLFSVGVPPDPPDYPEPRNLLSGGYRAAAPFGGHFNVLVDSVVYSTNSLLMCERFVDLDAHRLYASVKDTINWWIKTEWMITGDLYGNDSIHITQLLQPQESGGSGTVAMKWIIRNDNTVAHDIGLMVFLDTKIADNDTAAIVGSTLPYSDSLMVIPNEGRGWDLPPYWLAYQYAPGDTEHVDQLIARGVLTLPPNIPPDTIAFGDARDFLGTCWDLSYAFLEYDDSGVLMWWNPVTAPPGTTIIIQTSYGLSDSAATIGGIYGMSLTYPRDLVVSRCELLPNPFNLFVAVTNNADTTVSSMMINADFSSSAYCTLAPGEINPKPTDPPELGPSETGFVYWQLMADGSLPVMDYTDYFMLQAFTSDTFTETPSMNIWIEGSDYMGPEVYTVEPLFNTVTSDTNQQIKIYLHDYDSWVDTSRVFFGFKVIGDTTLHLIGLDDPRLSLTNDTLIFEPALDWVNGSYYWFELLQAEDIDGCPSDPDSGRFLVDLTGPIIDGHYPPESTIQTDSMLVNWVTCRDALSDIWQATLEYRLIIQTSSSPIVLSGDNPADGVILKSSSSVSYPDTAEFDPSMWSSGLGHIPDGYVTIALSELTDTVDYGIPNPSLDVPEMWSYIMNSHGPRVYPRIPLDGDYVSVADTDIVFYLYDGNSLIEDSTRIWIDGVTLPFTTPARDSIHEFVIDSTAGFLDGYEVMIEVLQAFDSLGSPLDMSSYTEWSYTVDLSAPFVCGGWPEGGDTAGIDSLEIVVELDDLYAGVDPSTLEIYVNGTLIDFVSYVSGEATFSVSGLADSATVRVRVGDSIDVGPPNWLDTSFVFYVNLEGPRAVFDGLSSGNICSATGPIRWLVTDPDTVNPSSICITVNSTSYDLTDPQLSYDLGSGLLEYTPASAWTDGSLVVACLDSARDMFGYGLMAPVCGDWEVDLDGPVPHHAVVETMFYDPGTSAYDHDQININYTWGDDILDSVMISVNGDVFTSDSVGVTVSDTMISFSTADAGVVLDSAVWYWFVFEAKTVCAFSEGDWFVDSLEIFSTEIDENGKPTLPVALEMLPNRPDPFNARTIVPFVLSKPGEITIEVSDVLGRRVRTLWSGTRQVGYHEVVWDGMDDNGRRVPSGVYNCRLIMGADIVTERITLIK